MAKSYIFTTISVQMIQTLYTSIAATREVIWELLAGIIYVMQFTDLKARLGHY